MPEVVSLLSSSPPRELCINSRSSRQSGNVPQPRTFTAKFPEIGSSDFEDSGYKGFSRKNASKSSGKAAKLPPSHDSDFSRESKKLDDDLHANYEVDEFPVEQSAKRRKVASFYEPPIESRPSRHRKSLADAEAVFDLSSEPDHSKEKSGKIAAIATAVAEDNALPSSEEVELPDLLPSAHLPETLGPGNVENAVVFDLSSDDVTAYNDPILNTSQLTAVKKSVILSHRTTSLLASLKSSGKHLSVTKAASVRQSGSHYKPTRKKSDLISPDFDDNIIDSSQPPAKGTKSVKVAENAEARVQKTTEDKAADKQRKQQEKETAKEQKRVEKEKLAAEKQLAADRAEVNRKKTDKKKTSEEMVVKIPYSLKGKSVANQVEEVLKQIDVDVKYYQADIEMANRTSGPVSTGAIIRWYRKVNSRYNRDSEEYEAATPKVEQEKHILVYLTAEEFCALAVAGPTGHASGDSPPKQPSKQEMEGHLDAFIATTRSKHTNVSLIVVIQGLAAYLKKSANTKNREYAAAVRALNPDEDAPTSSTTARTSKKRKTTQAQLDLSFLTQEHIDDLTLHLQLTHQPLHIHHTTSVATSAQQISAFTQHLSTRPYRLTEQAHNLAHASFCMASGQLKTGQGDVTETFLKMLEQVNRITPSMALGIVTEGYDTPRQLVEAFQKVESVDGSGDARGQSSREAREAKEKARMMLQDVRKALNKNGARSDKRLGPAASKRLYKVFMSKDENLRDGIL